MQPLRPDLQPLQLSRAHVLYQHVGARGQLQKRFPVALKIELNRKFVAPVHAEPNRVPVLRFSPAAERIAPGRLDLDHLGAKIGEDSGAKRRRDIVP